MTDRCGVIIGRIVSHPCAQRAAGTCSGCGTPVCRRHISRVAAGQCVVCSDEHTPPAAATRVDLDELYAFDRDDFDAFESAQPAPALHDYDS